MMNWLQWLPHLHQLHGEFHREKLKNLHEWRDDESSTRDCTLRLITASAHGGILLALHYRPGHVNQIRMVKIHLPVIASNGTSSADSDAKEVSATMIDPAVLWLLEDVQFKALADDLDSTVQKITFRCRLSAVNVDGDSLSHLVTTLPAKSFSSTMDDVEQWPWYRTLDSRLAVTGLTCARCNHHVLNTSSSLTNAVSVNADGASGREVLPLPSPFWHELIDCWICHPDDEQRHVPRWRTPATTQSTDDTDADPEDTKNIPVKKERWYMDATSIWVPVLNNATATMTADGDLFSCDNCQNVLGRRESRPQHHWPGGDGDIQSTPQHHHSTTCEHSHHHQHEPSTPTESTVESSKCNTNEEKAKFDVYFADSVHLTRVDAPPIAHVFTDCLLRRMYDINHAHAQSFFEISCPQMSEKKEGNGGLWLWIVNWSVQLCQWGDHEQQSPTYGFKQRVHCYFSATKPAFVDCERINIDSCRQSEFQQFKTHLMSQSDSVPVQFRRPPFQRPSETAQWRGSLL